MARVLTAPSTNQRWFEHHNKLPVAPLMEIMTIASEGGCGLGGRDCFVLVVCGGLEIDTVDR